MVRHDENYERHDRISTEDLVASGRTDGRDNPAQGTVHSGHPDTTANQESDVRDDLADARKSATVNGSADVNGAADAGGAADVNGADAGGAADVNGAADRKAVPPVPREQDEDNAALIEGSDSTRFRNRWHDVQAAFVDDPQRAVADADQLVAELMQTLAATFADRKHALEGRWQQGHDAETEDLRLAMRSYRSFFDQLLPH